MLHFLPAPLRGVLASLILLGNTLIFCWPLFIGACSRPPCHLPAPSAASTTGCMPLP